jgi:hypothetical protein
MKSYTIELRKNLIKAIEEIFKKLTPMIYTLDTENQKRLLFQIVFEWLLDNKRKYTSQIYYPSLSYEPIRREIKKIYRDIDSKDFTDDHMWNACIKAIKNIQKYDKNDLFTKNKGA